MKSKLIAIALALFTITTAMSQNTTPRITVQGQGIVNVTPDEATITISVDHTGQSAEEVKKANDKQVAAVNAFLNKFKLPQKDVITRKVNLSSYVESKSKKRTYQANQSIQIKLRDLARYDALMTGLTEAGITGIQGVQFGSSKLTELQSEVRKLAILHAKQKATDLASALNQNVGKALVINDNSNNYPAPRALQMNAFKASSDEMESAPTLQIGEIEIRTEVYAEFELL